MNDMSTFQEISKIEAAERQLAVAIALFLNDGDPISIHTLVGAANGILRPLCKEKGIGELLGEELLRPEKKKEFYDILRTPANFFKHAHKDADATLKFHPDVNQLHILDCLHLFSSLKGFVFVEGYIFLLWYVCNNPDSFISDAGRVLREQIRSQLPSTTGKETFREMLRAAKKIPRKYYPAKVLENS